MKSTTKLIILSFVLSLFGCTTDDSTTISLNFSQSEMLKNYTNNLIVPKINNYQASIVALNDKVIAFVDTPNQSTYQAVIDAQEIAYQNWAQVNAFQYGPALEIAFLASSNTFPTDYTKIEEDVDQENLNLGAVSSNNKKGLPAIDYLLFNDSEENTINTYINNSLRGTYLKAVSEDLLSKANHVNDAWNSDFATDFSTNEGNDPSSSLSYIVNEFNKAFERCKNQRVGYALGKNSLSGAPSPRSVEAYYSQQSLELLKLNVTSLKNFFRGNDGIGLDDYLTAYYDAGSIQEDLSAKILNQFDLIDEKLEACENPFSNHIEAQDEKVEALYTEMSNLVVMIKSEMPSALSVKITYQDSDGD